MSDSIHLESQPERIWRRKQVLDGIRERARRLFDTGAMGLQVASMLSEKLDRFVVSIIEETLIEFSEADRGSLEQECAMIVVGGSGRGEIAPFSDVDVLFVFRPRITDLIDRFSKAVVPEFWDAGVQLGQRVYTVHEAVRKAREDPHLASSLVHIRCLWGDELLAEHLAGRFFRRVIRGRRQFIESCIAGREEERTQHGATVQQLEPDVKKSLGGLRDVHLLQWVAFAYYETTDIGTLRKKSLLSHEDASALKQAVEFLTRVRIDLHLHAGKPHDTLSRDEQLRISETWGFAGNEAQRPVEEFMQEYFRHSMAVAEISRRFVSRHRPSSLSKKIHRAFVTHRLNNNFVLSPTELGVTTEDFSSVCSTLDDILQIYHSAATYRVRISPQLTEAITRAASEMKPGPTARSAALFMKTLSMTGRLGSTLRSMHDTNVLELVIPEWKHVRCLLQFNQYHHFTVDEHTLKCLELCESFAEQDSQIGAAYQGIRHRELLHLALILHDAAKGYPEDHSELGARMARDVCRRLGLSERRTDIVSFLVHRHLVMADLAFRHDISDPRVLLKFSHEVGTREKLDMLFVLTAADVGGVGPGVWNHWKSELLCEFHERLSVILSGQHPRFHKRERLRKVREHVYNSIVPLESQGEEEDFRRWIDQQLDEFTPNYLTLTSPPRIASDLDVIRSLEPGEVHVEGEFSTESGFTTYRIITDAQHSSGCFHLLAGALTARHLEILGAEITTTRDDHVVDVFHVIDGDYSGDVPEARITDIRETVQAVLNGETTVEELFRRHKTLSRVPSRETVMELPIRVTIDDDTSDRCTVISVFAHDQPGLLYTITKTLYQLGLSIELAKIATHFDQVADVLYVTDNDGRKIASESHQQAISKRLMDKLTAFEESTHREFVS
jgi:[protein-PII] uridylyltransferase